jgi:hypothetical protein
VTSAHSSTGLVVSGSDKNGAFKFEITEEKGMQVMTSKNELRSATMRLILLSMALCLGAAAHE